MEKEHYEIKYSYDGEYITGIYCNYCSYMVSRFDVAASKTGHRWPKMSHNIKRHLRDVHEINLYKRKAAS